MLYFINIKSMKNNGLIFFGEKKIFLDIYSLICGFWICCKWILFHLYSGVYSSGDDKISISSSSSFSRIGTCKSQCFCVFNINGDSSTTGWLLLFLRKNLFCGVFIFLL